MLLRVYNQQEIEKGRVARIEQVQHYLDGKGLFGALTVEQDKVPSWFRIYDNSNWKVMWSVALYSRKEIKQSGSITGNEILGNCVDQNPALVNCNVYFLEKPGFLLQVNMEESQLP